MKLETRHDRNRERERGSASRFGRDGDLAAHLPVGLTHPTHPTDLTYSTDYSTDLTYSTDYSTDLTFSSHSRA
jgi:hypothetical protein